MTVLLVDDDAATRSACADELRTLGVTVQEAASAQAALTVVREGRPAAVIVAYPMPLRDGRTLTAALREDSALRGLVIVAHSKWGWRRTRSRALSEGCDAFFEAPAPLPAIVEEICRRLGQQGRSLRLRAPVAGGLIAAPVG